MLRCAARCAQLRAAPPSRRFLSSAGADVSAALAAAAAADAGAGADAEWGREGVERVGVVMLNMGGPSSLHGAEDGVKPFLTRLFSDPEIIGLGGGLKQSLLARFIASRRSGRIAEQYSRIGGKSPIGDWTRVQASALSRALAAGEAASRASGAPPRAFRPYIAFRYAPPLTASALSAMAADGVTRAVAFPQYPQFSCTTSGSSLNHLWREAVRLRLRDRFAWSVLDRWHDDAGFVAAAAARVAAGLAHWPAHRRDGVVVVFSAHSVPMLVVNRGDAYVAEIAATAAAVMAAVRAGVALAPGGEVVAAPRAAHVLAWQSKVGFLPWMGPQTAAVLAGLGAARAADVLVVPIAFTSDHVETLFEIDVEYAELAHKAGIKRFERAPSLNEEPLLATAQAALLRQHLDARTAARSPQYALNCAGCTNPACRTILNPAHPYSTARDAARGAQAADVWPTQADVDRLQASEQPSA